MPDRHPDFSFDSQLYLKRQNGDKRRHTENPRPRYSTSNEEARARRNCEGGHLPRAFDVMSIRHEIISL